MKGAVPIHPIRMPITTVNAFIHPDNPDGVGFLSCDLSDRGDEFPDLSDPSLVHLAVQPHPILNPVPHQNLVGIGSPHIVRGVWLQFMGVNLQRRGPLFSVNVADQGSPLHTGVLLECGGRGRFGGSGFDFRVSKNLRLQKKKHPRLLLQLVAKNLPLLTQVPNPNRYSENSQRRMKVS